MELKVKLPGEIRALFELAGGEEIRYCSPFDINSSGKYCDFSYGVLTNRRLLIIEEGRIVYEMQLSGLSAMKCESQVTAFLWLRKRNPGWQGMSHAFP